MMHSPGRQNPPARLLGVASQQLDMINSLLARRLPGSAVRAFGSRVPGWPFGTGTKPYSDLDLAVWPSDAASDHALAELRADFDDSSLPWRVDVTVAADLPPVLRELVQSHGVGMQLETP